MELSTMSIKKKIKLFGVFAGKNIFQVFTKKKSQLNISIYQNLKQINISLWYDILETHNVQLLDKQYSEDKKYSNEELDYLNKEFSKLYDLFFNKLNNEYSKSTLAEKHERVILITKINILNQCIETLLFIAKNYSLIKSPLDIENKIYDTVKLLSKYVKFDPFGTIYENIEVIKKIIVSNESHYLRKYGKDTIEEDKNTYSLEEQLFDIGQIISSGIPNAKETSVEMFIVYINKANEISELRKKQQQNGKR